MNSISPSVSFSPSKPSILHRNMLLSGAIALSVVGFATFASPAKAVVSYTAEIAKIDTMSDTIAGMVSAMTDVAVLPMGLSAAMSTFRHIVLRNV